MIYNCAPLSFLDVDTHDYAYAMIGVYEMLDTALAADLFAWTYRRSIEKYAVVMESVGGPNPFRLKHREQLCHAVLSVVRDVRTTQDTMTDFALSNHDKTVFVSMLKEELEALNVHNCARHRVTMKMAEEWIKKGRRT